MSKRSQALARLGITTDDRLTAAEKRLVREVAFDGNWCAAGERSGLTPIETEQMAVDPRILAALDAHVNKNSQQNIVEARVIEELSNIAFVDFFSYGKVQDDGTFVFDGTDLAAGAGRAIQEVQVEEYTEGRGEEARPVKKIKFKLYNKLAAIKQLLELVRALPENVDEDDASTAATNAKSAVDRLKDLVENLAAKASRTIDVTPEE